MYTAYVYMLKKIIFLVVCSVLASPKTFSNSIGRVFRVSSVIDLSLMNGGDYIVITGLGGRKIKEGYLDINSEGDFVGINVITEVRKYNSGTNDIGPKIGNFDASTISWEVLSDSIVKKNGVVTKYESILYANGVVLNLGEKFSGTPELYNSVNWMIHSKKNIPDLQPGDEIEVSSFILATVTF
ncbi:hypothetical protein ACVTNF_001475 [Photobacterium damselae]